MVETDLFRSRQKWRWESEHWRGSTVAPQAQCEPSKAESQRNVPGTL